MTREETAIIIGNIPINEGDDCYTIAEYQEAKTMAIKALTQESCEDCISRQAVLVTMRNNYRDGGRDIDGDYVEGNYSKKLYDAIISLPPVTTQPKMGRWIPRNSFLLQYKCSECGRESEKYNYCPNCGAKNVLA